MDRHVLVRLLRPSHHLRLGWERVRRSIRNHGLFGTAGLALRRGGESLSRHRLKVATAHLRRRLAAVTGRLGVGPRVLRLMPLGSLCNHRCVMCWQHAAEPRMLREQAARDLEQCLKLPEYVRLLDELPPGVETVELLGGGEPLLHPEIGELCREIKRRRLRGFVITNGTSLTQRLAETLVEIGWDMIRVSVDAGDAETYRAIHGLDDFKRVVSNLRYLNTLRAGKPGQLRPRLFVLQVLLPHNVDRVESLFAFAEDVAADFLYFDRVIPFNPEVRLGCEAAIRAAADIASIARTSRVPCNLEWILHRLSGGHPPPAELPRQGAARGCLAGYDEVVVSSTGDVRPCCVLDRVFGNLRTCSFSDIWFGAEYERFRRDVLRGVWDDNCRGCWMDANLVA